MLELHVCVRACMLNLRSAEAIWPQAKHWLICQLNSLQATGMVLLKVHATGLAKGKNTSLLGMLEQIEMEV